MRHVGRYSKEETKAGGCLIFIILVLLAILFGISEFGIFGMIVYSIFYIAVMTVIIRLINNSNFAHE